jgi:hypothetical protein
VAIDYRSVNPEDVQTQVKQQRAQEAERAAFAAEMEVTRLEAVAASTRKKEEKASILEAAETARENAHGLRARANRLNKDDVLDADAAKEVHAEFLRAWVGSLEQEHVAHSTIVTQREEALTTTGDNAPGDDEKKDIQSRLDDSKRALEVIESSWKIATAKLDEVAPQDPADEPTE